MVISVINIPSHKRVPHAGAVLSFNILYIKIDFA